MPSPVGHSLIGLAIAAARFAPRGTWRAIGLGLWRERLAVLLVVAMSNAPDVDYIPGILAGELNQYHQLYTHTIGWAVAVSFAVWMLWKRWRVAMGWGGWVLLLGTLIGHLLADYVTADAKAPYGIMFFWPFSGGFFTSPVSIFKGFLKRDWGDILSGYNAEAVLVELGWCLPLLLGVALWKRRGAADGGLSA